MVVPMLFHWYLGFVKGPPGSRGESHANGYLAPSFGNEVYELRTLIPGGTFAIKVYIGGDTDCWCSATVYECAAIATELSVTFNRSIRFQLSRSVLESTFPPEVKAEYDTFACSNCTAYTRRTARSQRNVHVCLVQ